MLNPKKLTNKQLRCNLDRFTGTLFAMAPCLGIWFDDKEVKYMAKIENKENKEIDLRIVDDFESGLIVKSAKMKKQDKEKVMQD